VQVVLREVEVVVEVVVKTLDLVERVEQEVQEQFIFTLIKYVKRTPRSK